MDMILSFPKLVLEFKLKVFQNNLHCDKSRDTNLPAFSSLSDFLCK